MKKIFKNQKTKYLLFTILGVIIGGSIGITATTYVLKSSEIQYTNDKSVQQAIDELFVKAENCGKGSSETLPIGTIVSEGYKITIPYTGSYQQAKCIYGTTESYGSEGTISNNTCTFTGTSSNQKLYYKIVATNITSSAEGTVYENSGSATTGASGVTIVKNSLPTGVKAIVYLDPTNLGTACNASNSSVGGTAKSGCMKWYAYKEDSSSYTMILDHNTTAAVAWNSSGSNTSMKEVQTALASDTTGWAGIPRLITGKEVADITGISWTSTGSAVSFKGSNTPSDYYWLYDYTNRCTSYGCKVADSSTSGYWASTPYNSSSAWYVRFTGSFSYDSVSTSNLGVRPVITISKSSL